MCDAVPEVTHVCCALLSLSCVCQRHEGIRKPECLPYIILHTCCCFAVQMVFQVLCVNRRLAGKCFVQRLESTGSVA